MKSSRIAGRYRLKRQISREGIGVVWSAVDERSKLPVQISILERGVRDRLRVNHFRRSAVAAARLDHPNIAQVLDEGLSELGPFIVTEPFRGAPLSQWIKHQPPWSFIQPVMLQLCEVLAYIHVHDLLHLNLKPSRIFISERDGAPDVQITGVGHARMDDGWGDRPTDARKTLQYLGDLRYLAPEMAEAAPWMTGPWSDIYTLGLIFWELLVGEIPHEGHSGVSLLLKRAVDTHPQLPEGVPHRDHLIHLFQRLLNPRPELRPKRVAHVRGLLERLDVTPAYIPPAYGEAPLTPLFNDVRARSAAFPLSSLRSAPLVGRDEEMGAAWALIEGVVAGGPSKMIWLHASPGEGKSAIADHLCKLALFNELAEVWPITFEPNHGPASGLDGAIEDLLRATSTQQQGVRERVGALRLFTGIEPGRLLDVLPTLLRPSIPFAEQRGDEPVFSISAQRSAEVISGVFEELTHRRANFSPLLLSLDNLHFADEPALRMIERLLSDPHLQIGVLATIDAEHPNTLALRERFPGSSVHTWMHLEPVEEGAINTYLQDRLALVPKHQARLVAAAQGNLRWMRDLTRFLERGRLMPSLKGNRMLPGTLLPETEEEYFEDLLSALPHSGGDALVPDIVVGLAHTRLPLTPLIIEAFHADDPQLPYERALLAAERLNMMHRSSTGVWRFERQNLVRWLTEQGQERAPLWHQRWGQILIRLEGEAVGRLGLERATHAEARGELKQAVEALLANARWALGPGVAALTRGLVAARRGAVLADSINDHLSFVEAKRLEGELLGQMGHWSEAKATLKAARERLLTLKRPREEVYCGLSIGWLALSRGDLKTASKEFDLAHQISSQITDEQCDLWSLLAYGQLASLRGQHSVAQGVALKVTAAFERLGAERGRLASRLLSAAVEDQAGDFERAERRYAELQQIVDERGWLFEGAAIRLKRARVTLEMDRPAAAFDLMRAARERIQAARLDRLGAWLSAVWPAILAAMGEPREAFDALADAQLPEAAMRASALQMLSAALRQPLAARDPDLFEALTRWHDRIQDA